MSNSVRAVYENGVFRPLKPVALPEGAEVHVVISDQSDKDGAAAAAILAEIAALPVEGDGDPFTSRDHDQVLYGEREHP
jgi:predicted DNA-binding antitoxin AbrB/MazE fold protein